LFGVSHDRISVVIHPQSVIHSMVAYHDGSVIAQLGIPDMKAAIAYALSYPQRLPLKQRLPDFSGGCDLTFQDPDLERFPCLALAYSACEVGGSMPAVLNAANEVAVHSFLERMISFTDITSVVRETMADHRVSSDPTLDEIRAADGWARKRAKRHVEEFRKPLTNKK
jgi:1-deoxy-D-xylulose-5-phosphate reductoisomerase